MMKKLFKKKVPKEEPVIDDIWKDDYVAPQPKQTASITLKTKIASLRSNPWKPRPTLYLIRPKQVLALVLVGFYLLVSYLVVLSSPVLLLLLVPTVYILLDYVKVSGKKRVRNCT